MELLPRRATLAGQVAETIREGLKQGQWKHHLPGERSLSNLLQVSRDTVRLALQELQQEGLIRIVRGQPRLIATRRRGTTGEVQSHTIGLIRPTLEQQPSPYMTALVDELRARFQDAGYRLSVHSEKQYFTASPSRALSKFIADTPVACWILQSVRASGQRWFQRQRIPAIVLGCCHAGVDLPSIDCDFRAMARSAVGLFLANGHTRIVFLVPRSGLAGDALAREGFLQGVRMARRTGLVTRVITYTDLSGGAHSILRVAFNAPDRPTALLVLQPIHVLTVVSGLARIGIRIPEESVGDLVGA